MPARVARSSLPIGKRKRSKIRTEKQGGNRSLQAYSLANEQEPEIPKIRRHRLGDTLDDDLTRPRKRQRNGDAGSDDELEPSNFGPPQQKKAKKGRVDEVDLSDGSDSDGNTWKYGHVSEDDDEDIDSDEAFDEEDEQRFAGFVFRGSSGGNATKANRKLPQTKLDDPIDDNRIEDHAIDLKEHSAPEDSDDDSLGEEAIDLATALDQYSGSEQEEDESNSDTRSDDERHEEAEHSDFSMSDMDDDDQDKLARLQDLVTTMHPNEIRSSTVGRPDVYEGQTPSTTGILSERFDIKDLFASSDPSLKRVAKEFTVIPRASSQKSLKLGPQLPKRQQDKIDRRAASKTAKETLGRWDATVKQNRIAEHLTFPLVDSNQQHPPGQKLLMHTTQTAPLTELESTIQNIMKESGLGNEDPNAEEKRLEEAEGLQARSIPVEEILARRAELRKQRELLFREEKRAKRIKKIKSKTYRRVHRKERERLAERERDAFTENPEEMDDEEREAHDRRRAEERMRSKHRNSKWAKQMKKTGRSVWDEEARAGVTEMARRNEELRRRMEGKEVRDSGNDDGSYDESEDDGNDNMTDDESDVADIKAIERLLERETGVSAEGGTWNRLAQMDFMKNAELRRKEENDKAIVQIRKELAGEESSSSDSEEDTIGRRLFGPTSTEHAKAKAEDDAERNPLEAPEDMEESGYDDEFLGFDEEPTATSQKGTDVENVKLVTTTTTRDTTIDSSATTLTGSNGISNKCGALQLNAASQRDDRNGPLSKLRNDKHITNTKTLPEPEPELLPGEMHSRPDADGWVTVNYEPEEGTSENEPEVDQIEVVRRAFAGDDVEVEFAQEKAALVEEQNTKFVDNGLPGWGSWVGDGLTRREKREQQRNRGRFLTKVDGIKPESRKDRKLKNVIINQRRIKNNVEFMANILPYPFKDKQEYERSIRMPVGNEWNTSGVFQENIKPRVMVRPGEIIKPIEKPLMS